MIKLTDEAKLKIVEHIASGAPPAKRKPDMTWGEFKAAVEAAGVTDDTEMGYIDWSSARPPEVRMGDVRASVE